MTWSLSMRRRIVKVAAVFAVVAILATGLNALFSRGVHGSGSCAPGSCGSGGGGRLICPVVFEAVTGSGEYPNNKDLTTASGLQKVSPELYAVYNNITFPPGWVNSDGTSRPVVSIVKYPALPVDVLIGGAWLWPDQLPSNLRKYLGSERDGVAALSTAIAQARSVCPTTQFILAGYSQGAMVVHDYLDLLAATGYATVQASIIGAVLVADPDRVKHSAVRELSTAPSAGYGVCDVASTLHIAQCPAAGPLRDINPLFQSRTVSVCKYDDVVCDTSDLLGAADLVTSLRFGVKVHTSYQYLLATGYAGKVMSQFLAAHF